MRFLMFSFRYCQLEDPMGRRHQQLEDSLKFHEFVHDIEDEMAWIREREPLAHSAVLGNSLTNVQGLLKKHQVTLLQNVWLHYSFLNHQLLKSSTSCSVCLSSQTDMNSARQIEPMYHMHIPTWCVALICFLFTTTLCRDYCTGLCQNHRTIFY